MPTLREVYEDPRTSTRNAALLASRAGTTLKSAQAFLRNEASAQVTQAWKKPAQDGHNYAPTGAPADHWQADTAWFTDYRGVNDKRRAALTVLNTTTRYAAARPLIDAKSSRVAEALDEIIDELEAGGRHVAVLRVDNGPEFKGETRALLRKRGIEVETVEPFTHYRLARTDRYHRTLRKRIGEHFERAQTHRWVDALPGIVGNMNTTPHRTLSDILGRPTAPADVTPAAEDLIRAAEIEEAELVRAKSDEAGIVPGVTRVRLLYKNTKEGVDAFAKGQRAVWTTETYLVLARNGPNSWLVDVPTGSVRIWPTYAMRIVDGSALARSDKRGDKVDISIERAKAALNRDISENELAANLAAPARPKSQRAPKVAYAAPKKAGRAALVVGKLYASEWGSLLVCSKSTPAGM